MAITPLTVTIDLNPSYKKIPAVYVSQLDNNLRSLAITVQDGGVNYDVASSGYDVYVEGTKPDKHGFSYKVTDIGGTVVGAVVTVPMQTQMTCVQGMVPTEIVLKSGSDRIGSANFLLVVERAGLAEDVDVSETDIPAYIDGAQQAAAAAAQSADDAEDAKDLAVAAKDTAVSVAASIPADYTALSESVEGLRGALSWYNATNAYEKITGAVTPTSVSTSNGITTTPKDDGSYDITGTATANTNVCNFYNKTGNLPSFFEIGKTYTFMLETTSAGNFDFRLQTYVGSAGTLFKTIAPNTLTEVTVPSGITGVSMFVRVPNGEKVDGNVRLIINDGTLTNQTLSRKVLANENLTILQKDLATVKNDFYKINGRFSPAEETTTTGLTITPYDDGHFHIEGTATANTIAQFYVSSSAFPDYLPKNTEKTVQFLTDSEGYAELRFNVYNPSSKLFQTVYKNTSAKIKLPSTATGFSAYVRIPSGETVNGDFYMVVNDGDLTNKAGSKALSDIANVAHITTADLSLFKSIGVIGDSFATGWFYKDVSGTLTRIINREHSWPVILGRKHGCTIGHFCYGGLDTGTWQADENGLPALLAADPCECYLLMLGINDVTHRGTEGLGTIADIKTDYTLNPNTFYGDYGKIIAQVMAHAPNAKLIISTMTHSGGNYDAYNSAIEEIADHFGIALMRQLESPYFSNATLYQGLWVNGHPTSIQASAMADAINELFTNACNEYYSYFADLC